MNRTEMRDMAFAYAKQYNPELKELIERDPEMFADILYIEKDKENPRKDYEKFGDLVERIGFFYKEKYDQIVSNPLPFNEKFDKETIKDVLVALKEGLSLGQDEQSWFANMKSIGGEHGFAGNNKEFKANPEAFKGTIGDVAEILRISLTGRKNSPNLYYVMKILKKEECDRRIDLVLQNL